MIEQLAIELGPARLQLLADRAVYWPAQRMLVIADLHLGKGDVFRRQGIAVPRGSTGQDLSRLDALLAHTGAQVLMILGDVLHGAANSAHWQQQWAMFVARWPQLRVQAVLGNHDRALRASRLEMELLGDGLQVDGLTLCHDRDSVTGPALAGHVHPVVRLPGLARALPVFWQQHDQLVLPAFSAFTGGHRLRSAPDHLLYACNGEQLVAL
jgi:DNA ligase-associated metallophosphoesterase